MIFIDSNVPMFLVGAPHPHKADAQRRLEEAVAAGDRLVTSVEVFQEILHRYVAIDRRDAIQPAWDVLAALADEVLPIEMADADAARVLVVARSGLSARDALHAAVMARHGITRILTFDAGFDALPGVRRIS